MCLAAMQLHAHPQLMLVVGSKGQSAADLDDDVVRTVGEIVRALPSLFVCVTTHPRLCQGMGVTPAKVPTAVWRDGRRVVPLYRDAVPLFEAENVVRFVNGHQGQTT